MKGRSEAVVNKSKYTQLSRITVHFGRHQAENYLYGSVFHGLIRRIIKFTHTDIHVDAYYQHPPFAAEASAAGTVAVAEPPVSTAEAGSAAALPNAPKTPMTRKNRF